MKKALIILTAVMGTVGVFGQEESAEEKKGVETTISIGSTRSDGNKKAMQANASIVIEGEKETIGSFRVGVEANYGEVTVDEIDETTVDNQKGYANAKKTLSEKTFTYIDASTLRDDIAEIDYRAILGAGLGVYLVKNDSVSFFVETGPSYIWDDVAGEKDNYLALRIAERIDFKISKNAKIWQSLEYIPELSEFDNYLINAEIGAEAALTSMLNLRVVLQDEYDSQPGADLEKNDIMLITGVSINL